MSGVKDKLQAIDDYLGIWYRTKPTTWMNIEGKYLLYNLLTNRLVLDNVIVHLDENGSAQIGGKLISFSQLQGDTYHLTKRPIKQQTK